MIDIAPIKLADMTLTKLINDFELVYNSNMPHKSKSAYTKNIRQSHKHITTQIT